MPIWHYILYALLALHVSFALFSAYGWWRLARAKQVPSTLHLPPLSVIIALHNEGPRVLTCLTRILQQDYPLFEVIAVCDRSTDATLPELEALAVQHDYLRIVEIHTLPTGWSGKKHAISTGIAAAQYDHFAFTDADCDVPPGWLSALAAPLAAGKQVVLGYGPLFAAPGLANLFARYDTLAVAAQYLGWAAAGLPYMAVGRNLAYSRAFWQHTGGYDAHAATPSGDDDIAINRYARAHTVAVLTAPTSHVYSFAPLTLGAWLRQKVRHVGAVRHYTVSSKLLLGLATSAQHLTLPLMVLLWCISGVVWHWAAIWAAAYMMHAAVLAIAMWVLNQRALALPALLYMPIFQTLLYALAGLKRMVSGRHIPWK